MNNIKILYYDRTDVSKGIDLNKMSASKECDIFYYWYFLNKGFKFQPNVSNRCHDLLILSMNFSDIVILNIKNVDYCCIINRISKSNTDLTNKRRTMKIKHKNLISHIDIGR